MFQFILYIYLFCFVLFRFCIVLSFLSFLSLLLISLCAFLSLLSIATVRYSICVCSIHIYLFDLYIVYVCSLHPLQLKFQSLCQIANVSLKMPWKITVNRHPNQVSWMKINLYFFLIKINAKNTIVRIKPFKISVFVIQITKKTKL